MDGDGQEAATAPRGYGAGSRNGCGGGEGAGEALPPLLTAIS